MASSVSPIYLNLGEFNLAICNRATKFNHCQINFNTSLQKVG